IQALAIGPVRILGTPCELLTGVGAEARRRSRLPDLWVLSYANGDVGYVPAPKDFPKGGYEVTGAHMFYDSPRFARNVGTVLAREAARILRHINGRHKRSCQEPQRAERTQRTAG
ncbi:unnamed protein product, partial [marine sediment metagenome]